MKDKRIEIRCSAGDRDKLRRAAKRLRLPLSSYVLLAALEKSGADTAFPWSASSRIYQDEARRLAAAACEIAEPVLPAEVRGEDA